MSDVQSQFRLGDPPRESDFTLWIVEHHKRPNRFWVCLQNKYKTIPTRDGTLDKFRKDFSLDPATELTLSVESGNWSYTKTEKVELIKVYHGTLPAEFEFFPPMNIGTTMAVEVKLLNKYNKPIVETGPVVVNFPEPVRPEETKPGVEHPAGDNMATETDNED